MIFEIRIWRIQLCCFFYFKILFWRIDDLAHCNVPVLLYWLFAVYLKAILRIQLKLYEIYFSHDSILLAHFYKIPPTISPRYADSIFCVWAPWGIKNGLTIYIYIPSIFRSYHHSLGLTSGSTSGLVLPPSCHNFRDTYLIWGIYIWGCLFTTRWDGLFWYSFPIFIRALLWSGANYSI
jgi:hypothetical protein